MNTEPITTFIQCHGSDAGESWECSLMRGVARLAFVTGLPSHHVAKQAAEYLRFGLAGDWETVPRIDAEILDAGVHAVNEWVDPGEGSREADMVSCVWDATINAWTRKMLDRQNGGTE